MLAGFFISAVLKNLYGGSLSDMVEPIVVLSHSITKPPENLRGRIKVFPGEIPDLVSDLECKGLQHAYIDGGSTITSFLNLQLINEMTITKAPVLLGDGIPLFGKIDGFVKLKKSAVSAFPNNVIQIKYNVDYS